MEDRRNGSSEFPVDMSVSQRDSRSEASSTQPQPQLQPHGYMPIAVDNRAYFSALYANMNTPYAFLPQDPLNQQRFHAQRTPLPPMVQHPMVSTPPSQRQQRPRQQRHPQPHPQPHQQSHPQSHQQSHPQSHPQSHQQPPTQPQQQQQLQTPPNKTSSSTLRRSPAEEQFSPEAYPGFKLKDSKGKLAVLDYFSDSSSHQGSMEEFLPSNTHQRAKREFVPDEKKDNFYWTKRVKNNDSARRSRVKRKALEKVMETRLMELQKENIELRHEMAALKRKYDADGDGLALPALPLTPVGGDGGSTISNDFTSDYSPSLSRDEELEQQSAGSDDSHSHDDSRAYNISSIAALAHSLGPSRDRTGSFGSATSSGGPSSRPESRSSQAGNLEYLSRMDRSGALDLSNASDSNRSTPAQESASLLLETTCKAPKLSKSESNANDDNDMEVDEKRSSGDMKGFPLKCRFKRERQSQSLSLNGD